MTHQVKIINKRWLTHDVMQLQMEKPMGFKYNEGQAIEASIDNPEFRDIWSPFTFTSLSDEELLELTIKIYPDDDGLTLAMSSLKEGDSFQITEPFDTFKNRGPGVFIAGGTGITPFIALIRRMYIDGSINSSILLFANKTEKDIFLYDEFSKMLGKNYINILSRENNKPYLFGRINKNLLKNYISDFAQPFYICGPDAFVNDITKYLKELEIKENLVNISL